MYKVREPKGIDMAGLLLKVLNAKASGVSAAHRMYRRLAGAWAIDFRHPDGRWVSKVYPEIKTRTEAKHFLSIIRTDILRNKFNLPDERAIPTLKEYSKRYLELCKNSKENTFIAKQRAVNILVEHLGDYRLDKFNDVVVEKYIIKRQDEGIKPGSLISFIASKTGKLVTVPLSSYLASELQTYKANSPCNGIFENRTITSRIANTYSSYFWRVFRGLNFCGFSFHGLRHTFLSLHGDLGTGAFKTKEMAGHSTLDMTLRYTHVNLDSKRKAIEAYTGHVLNSIDKVMSLKVQTG